MSYQHLGWAYDLKSLRGRAKPVLVALADQADSDGECWPGQQRLADMTGVSTKTVERACQRLEELGLISRFRRHTSNGFRTSDRYQLHTDVTDQQLAERLGSSTVTTSSTPASSEPVPAEQDLTDNLPTRQDAYKAERLLDNLSGLPDNLSAHREVPSLDPPGEPPETPVVPAAPTAPDTTPSPAATRSAPATAAAPAAQGPDPKPAAQRRSRRDPGADLDAADAVDGARFEDFWHAYPRHDDRRRAENAWRSARRRTDPAAIVAAANRYRDDLNREQQFTKQPATWLNADAWANDPLPPRTGSSGRESSIARRDRQVAAMWDAIDADGNPAATPIGALTR